MLQQYITTVMSCKVSQRCKRKLKPAAIGKVNNTKQINLKPKLTFNGVQIFRLI